MLRIITSAHDLGRPDHGMGEMAALFLRSGGEELLHSVSPRPEVVAAEPSRLSGQQVVDYFAVQAAIADEVRRAVDDGAFPFVLGGNCGAVLGAVSGLPRPERTGVVWFDAHADANTPETTDGGYLDGMPVAVLTGRCWQRMAVKTHGFARLPDEQVLLAGVRSIDPAERELLGDSGLRVVPPEQLEANLPAALDALAARTESVHLHVDLDVIDPSDGRVNQFHEGAGPSLESLERAIALTGERCALNGISLTAYDPTYDTDGRALRSGLRVMASLLAAAG